MYKSSKNREKIYYKMYIKQNLHKIKKYIKKQKINSKKLIIQAKKRLIVIYFYI